METYSETTYELSNEDQPIVTVHDNINFKVKSVGLSLPGYFGGSKSSGRGFTVRFVPAQLPALERLCLELRKIQGTENKENSNLF